jgi:hypothetical protein
VTENKFPVVLGFSGFSAENEFMMEGARAGTGVQFRWPGLGCEQVQCARLSIAWERSQVFLESLALLPHLI